MVSGIVTTLFQLPTVRRPPRFAAGHHRAAHVGGLHARGATPGETRLVQGKVPGIAREMNLMGFYGISRSKIEMSEVFHGILNQQKSGAF